MTNALTLITPNDIMTTATALIKSGFLPKSLSTVDQVFTLITMSQELQVGMWQAINGINIIQGKPTVSPQLMLALINRSGQLEDMTITEGADYCEVTMKRHGRSAYTYRFTDADAKAMGLLDKDNWRKQKPVMRKWRTVSGCSRVVFPDVIQGMYTTEEIAPDNTMVSEDGEVTYAAPIVVERPAQPEQIAASAANAIVDPAPAAEFERRSVVIKAVKRVATGKKPMWGVYAYDYAGAEYRFTIASRDDLKDHKPRATDWNTEVNTVTELTDALDVTVEFEAGKWYFVAVNS